MMGLPEYMTHGGRCFFQRLWCRIFCRGPQDAGFWCLRGIKQGCPMSGSLWAIAFDPVMGFLCARAYSSACSHSCCIG
eukprot:4013907-Pyramimonas_sp.AAC.1